MKVYYPFLFYILLEPAVLVTALFNKKLRHYEVIKVSDISHHVRRRDVGDEDHMREITLTALGRTLQLELIPKPHLFARNFKAVTVDANGNKKEFTVNENEFYQGFLKGEEGNSTVSAHIHDNLLTAAIESQNDTYHVEPASGHIEGDTTNKMIAYRDSDVVWNVTFARNHTKDEGYCGLNTTEAKTTSAVPVNVDRERKESSSRRRRSVRTKLKCGLALVADNRYFKNMGEESKTKTTVSMVGVINRVDEIFKNTDWSVDDDESYKNYGFVIKQVEVHVQPGGRVYNQVDRMRTSDSLLEKFSQNNWGNYCLAHLFTYQDFKGGVVGYANIGDDERHGICASGDGVIWHNTGLSSSFNWGNQLLTAEADLVTAHGHNFGGRHDAQSDSECSPNTGGKYIMYPAAVSGRELNNKKFSKCSRRAIKRVLQSKANLCFSEPNETIFCGNFRVEGKEQCDSGTIPNDVCCTKQCQLAKGAACSDTNGECCSGCQIANTSFLCSPAQPLLCKKASYCSGTSQLCPKADPADEGTDCIEKGKCDKFGKCKPFCETVNPQWKPCLCSNDKDGCFFCCIKSNGACEIYRNNSERIPLSDGRLCYNGVCREGKCKKEAQDFINRLQDFFETLRDPSKFGEFLKDNIVGTVIVFSLIVWIPLSVVVNRIDKRRDKQAKDLASWQDRFNQDLIRQPNRRHDFDVVFKKDGVFLRDSRKAINRGGSPNRRRVPSVE